MLRLLLFFGLGVISDIFVALYTHAVASGRAFRASVHSFIIPVLVYLVLAKALETHSVVSIVVFALGNSLGTYITVRHIK